MPATPLGQLADAFGAATGAVVSPPPPPPSDVVPRRLVSGITSRSRSRTTAAVLDLLKAGVGGGQVLEVFWRDLQPTNGTTLDETAVLALKADLDWAQSHGLGVLLRVFAGYYAPDWARAAAGGSASGGGMLWYTNDGPLAAGASAASDASWKLMPRPLPRWWDAGYQSSYAAFIVKLGAETRITGHPALCGVSMSAPMTQYAEPMVKQFALVENRNAAIAAGYSQAADEAAYTSGFQAHKTSMSPLGVATYCSFNDYQQISGSGGIKIDPTITVRIMEQMVTTLGRLAVIENNGLQYPTTKYPTMYARMRAFRQQTPPVPLHFQTETLPKHEALWDSQPVGGKLTSPKATAQMALSWGACAIELPTGFENASMAGTVQRWPGLSLADAAALNQQGYDNTVGLTAPAPKPLTVATPSDSPAVTTVSDSSGTLATLTTGAKTVLMRGPARTFTENKKPFKDDFVRTTTNGFGRSPGGGAYSNTTGADAIFSVTGGTAKIALDVAGSSRYTTMVNDAADVNVVTRWTMDEIPVGNAASLGLVIGYADPNNNYRARLSISTAGVVQLTLEKEVAGVTTALGSLTQVGTGWVANEQWLIRLQRAGTTIRCRAWKDGTTEPSTWLHSVTDSDLGAGRIGLRAFASTGNTNVPVNFLIDYIDVQTCTWPNPIGITHTSWVRALSAPYSGTWSTTVEAQIRAWDGDTSPDALAYASLYQTGAAVALDTSGNQVSGEAGYGPLNTDGTLQEGADFHEYMGVGWTFPSGETAPDAGASWEGKLDCSGFVRMVYGYWLGVPLSVSTLGGTYLPRVSHDMADSGPGVLIASAVGAVPSMSRLQVGDVVGFDADSAEAISGQIDHVGIYVGTDSLGVPRFVSSRKTPNGPTFADLGGSSALTGSGLYATRLRKIRRF